MGLEDYLRLNEPRSLGEEIDMPEFQRELYQILNGVYDLEPAAELTLRDELVQEQNYWARELIGTIMDAIDPVHGTTRKQLASAIRDAVEESGFEY